MEVASALFSFASEIQDGVTHQIGPTLGKGPSFVYPQSSIPTLVATHI